MTSRLCCVQRNITLSLTYMAIHRDFQENDDVLRDVATRLSNPILRNRVSSDVLVLLGRAVDRQ